ncbi:MAG TPA: Amuc_1100 family pilus-like protein [Chthoniobacterales bacterium]|jgi:hypothetical protein
MNWFQQNRFFAAFLGALGLATLFGLCFLFHEKRAAHDATTRLEATVNELNRLRQSVPFPNEKNLRKTRAQTKTYGASLLALENELKNRMLPELPLLPNEFQAQLRLALNEVQDAAAKAKVQLPLSFHLGFDEYASSLPNGEAAPPLGRQLRAVERIMNMMIEARIDSLGSLIRAPLLEEKSSGHIPNAANTGPALSSKTSLRKIVDLSAIDLAFSASPTAARRTINQIAACKDQVYVIRTLVVKNQVDKGPKRSESETVAAALASAPKKPASSSISLTPKATKEGINFIVGTEHLDLAARIEIMSFSFPEKEPR